jgi:hypothetical protein
MTDTRTPTRLRSNPRPRPSVAVAATFAALVVQTSVAGASGGGIGGSGALSLASAPAAGPETCAIATRTAEITYGLPPGLMTAISTVESGRYDPVLQANLAWPWTINAEGAGAHFETKAEAIAEVEALLASGVESIDVGCMQVNLRWHPNAFASLEDAFDPAINADYAARLLLQLFQQHGDWPTAIGHYHSPTDWRQQAYQAKVAEAWAAIGGSFAGLPVAAAAAAPTAPSGPILFGGLVAAGGPTIGGAAPAGGLLGAAGPSAAAATPAPVPRAAAGATEGLRFFPLQRP